MILEPCIPSAQMTVGTTTVASKAALLHSIILNPAAVSGTVTVYDNTAGSGTQVALLQGIGLATTVGSSVIFTPPVPVYCTTGLTVVVAGTGAVAQIYYQREA